MRINALLVSKKCGAIAPVLRPFLPPPRGSVRVEFMALIARNNDVVEMADLVDASRREQPTEFQCIS
jgi:hypothetical protein